MSPDLFITLIKPQVFLYSKAVVLTTMLVGVWESVGRFLIYKHLQSDCVSVELLRKSKPNKNEQKHTQKATHTQTKRVSITGEIGEEGTT